MRNRAIGQVRIISGKWRGRKLPVLNAEGLRPTSDRTKETLFNWLSTDIYNMRCLDAFAGAGSLGLEACSRGASEVIMFEKDKRIAKSLHNNIEMLSANAKVFCGDSLVLIKKQKHPFDLVFLDPPFGKNLISPCLSLLQSQHLLADEALLYVEHESDLSLNMPESLSLIKEKKTRQFRYALYSKRQ